MKDTDKYPVHELEATQSIWQVPRCGLYDDLVIVQDTWPNRRCRTRCIWLSPIALEPKYLLDPLAFIDLFVETDKPIISDTKDARVSQTIARDQWL